MRKIKDKHNNDKVVQAIRDLNNLLKTHESNFPPKDIIQVTLNDGKTITIEGDSIDNILELYKIFEVDVNLLDDFSLDIIQKSKEYGEGEEINEELVKRDLIMNYVREGVLEYFLYLQFIKNNQFILDVSLETSLHYKMFIKTIVSLLTESVEESTFILTESLMFLMKHNSIFYLNKIGTLLDNLNNMIKNDKLDIHSGLNWKDVVM